MCTKNTLKFLGSGFSDSDLQNHTCELYVYIITHQNGDLTCIRCEPIIIQLGQR